MSFLLSQATAESSKVADIKPRILDNTDKVKSWKFPDIIDPVQLKALRLPDPLTASKVCSRSIPLRSVLS